MPGISNRAMQSWIGLLVLAYGLAAYAQTRLSVSVDSGRPVADAVELLEERHGYVITYEDPEYVHEDDFKDVTESVARGPYTPGRKRVIVPRGGALFVSYEIGPDGLPLDPEKVISSIVAAGSSHGLHFDDWQSNPNTFHVVPVSLRDRSGKEASYQPLLDTRISFSPKDRDGNEFLHELFRAISRARQFRIGPGTMPTGRFRGFRISRGASNETARDLLTSYLATVDPQLSWQLFTDQDGAALNIHLVPLPQSRITARPAVVPSPVQHQEGGILGKIKALQSRPSVVKKP